MVREERIIEVTIISATGLKKVATFERDQKCYVVTYIYPTRRQTIPADPHGGVNPMWNTTLTLTCYESHLHPATSATTDSASTSSSNSRSSLLITIDIYSHGSGFLHGGDKLVGTVTVPLQEFSSAKTGELAGEFEVRLSSGEPHGTLKLSVKLGAKRELGEYENPAGPQLPSSSSDTTEPSVKHPLPNAEEESVATGYPAQGYAFDPLGQKPKNMQQQFGSESGVPGQYGAYFPPVPQSGVPGQYGAYYPPGPQSGAPGQYGSYPPESYSGGTHGSLGRDRRGRHGQRRRRGPIKMLIGGIIMPALMMPMMMIKGHRQNQDQAQAPNQSQGQYPYQGQGQYPYQGQVPNQGQGQYSYQGQVPNQGQGQYSYQGQVPNQGWGQYSYQGQVPNQSQGQYSYQGQLPNQGKGQVQRHVDVTSSSSSETGTKEGSKEVEYEIPTKSMEN